MKQLPDSKSGLLELVIQEVEKTEKLKGYKIDLDYWYEFDEGVIKLCLAGCLMKWLFGKKLDMIETTYLAPTMFKYKIEKKLNFIDRVGTYIQNSGGPKNPIYSERPKKFKKKLKKLVKYYKKNPDLDNNQDWSF